MDQSDSFRGTCLKCGGPVAGGANIHKECAQLELRATQSFGDANKMAGQRQYIREPFPPKTIARIPQMANVQVCERCGSIGQSRDFVSLNATTMEGTSLVFPRLVTTRQFEREQEESMEEETAQTNFTMCRMCKSAFRNFLQNEPTQSGTAGPIGPQLPKPTEPQPENPSLGGVH